jgi:hypothetical protein
MKSIVKNRKIVRLGGFILVLVLLLTSVNISQAQWLGDDRGDGRIANEDPPPLPDISTYEGTAEFTFEQLGHDTFELNSPSTRQFSQDFPYRWAIVGGITNSYIDIHFDLVDLDAGQPYVSERDLYLPTLEVQVNGIFAGAFVPQPGLDQVVRVPIPVDAVLGADSNTHRFRFLYYRGVDCIGDASSKLLIYDDSTISISYLTAPAVLNLADFPRPLVQESFIPETLQMIIPDNYSEHDLTVAAIVAASIGNRAFGNLTVNLLKASDATFERLSISSAVIIGRPDANAFLAQLYAGNQALTSLQSLPTRLSVDGSTIVGTEGQVIQPEDGVLQLVRSSVNTEHSYLIVTGVNDEAVMLAAQALSGVRPSIPLNNRLAVIKEYQEDAPLAEAEEEGPITLAELGFRDTTYYGIGAQSVTVSFFVPHNWRIQDGVALHLAYIHSSQLSHGYSSLTVSLNGDPIGSAPINTDVIGEQMVVIAIQPEDIRLGEFNRLTFDIILNVRHDCVALESQVAWLRIRDVSFINLPYELVSHIEDLGEFSNPFFYLLSERGISNILVSLPPEPDQAVLNGMIRFAHLLGEEMRKPYFNFVVSMDATLSPDDHPDYHIVAFGRPTTNPLVMQVNDKMPQPFLEGGDVLGQDVGNVVYRLPTEFSMGVIEVFSSPWNSAKGVTVVSGTTAEGFSWAMDTYTDKNLVRDLDGDIALVVDDLVEVLMSRGATRRRLLTTLEEVAGGELIVETVEPEVTEAATGELPERYQPREEKPPISTIIVYAVVILGVVLAVAGTMKTILDRRKS